MVRLDNSDFTSLTGLLQKLPEFSTSRDRFNLLIGAGLDDYRIVGRVNFEGPSRTFIIELIRLLSNFGKITYDREALGVLLSYVRELLSDEDADAALLDQLIHKYSLNKATSIVPKISKWEIESSDDDLKEVIIGENTLRPIAFVQKAWAASDAVAHLLVTKSDGLCYFGTGYVIANDLLVTNNHVVSNPKEANSLECTFRYQLDVDGNESPTIPAKVLIGGWFYTNQSLDFTVLQLAEEIGKTVGYLRLFTGKISMDQRVNIIQHPGGHPKRISLQNNRVAYVGDGTIQYYTSTMPGSSGSPVFNDDFEVVAIHHSGGKLLDPSVNQRFLRNAGTTSKAMLDDLKANSKPLYSVICEH
jgi:V8-like Glu-specific endopeptidase